MAVIEPYLRWAGGKRWLVNYILDLISSIEFNHYVEPFLGGGAVFFALEHKRKAYLSDINLDLISTYQSVRDNPAEVQLQYTLYQNTADCYYLTRATIPQTPEGRAARFIFLNQTSYNGLYRVNRNGEYNVPYGYRSIDFDISRIEDASCKLKKANISCCDFSEKKYSIKEGDLVFIDPPYTTSHNHNGFIKYNQHLFSIDDQWRLSKYIDYLKQKKAYYILTNAAHPIIREIFEKHDNMITLDRYSLIGGKNSARQKVSEYIFTNIPGGKA